jgi:hypothetical protein
MSLGQSIHWYADGNMIIYRGQDEKVEETDPVVRLEVLRFMTTLPAHDASAQWRQQVARHQLEREFSDVPAVV